MGLNESSKVLGYLRHTPAAILGGALNTAQPIY